MGVGDAFQLSQKDFCRCCAGAHSTSGEFRLKGAVRSRSRPSQDVGPIFFFETKTAVVFFYTNFMIS